jgi:hypothetical protein
LRYSCFVNVGSSRVAVRLRSGPLQVAAATALLVILASAQPASAAPREAQERFDEGRALVKAGHPQEAIPKFLASIAAEPTLAALLNVADCYERTGKLASARTRFKQAQALAKEKDALRADEARKRVELLDARVSTLTLVPPARGSAARVWLDGVEVPSSEWGSPGPLDAGAHEVVVLDGATGKRRTSTVDVPGDAAHATFAIALDDPPAAATVVAPPVAPDRPSPAPPPASSSRGTIGLIIGATGVVALGVGAVTGIVALGASSDLKSACPTYPRCSADRRDEFTSLDDRARTMGTVSTVTILGGAVLVVAGAVLYLTAPKASSSSSGALATPRWAGITW